jgi:penicillin-insensitive murein DD-endopeptidase
MNRASFCLAAALFGCAGMPTPLAPSLGGSIGGPSNGVQTDAQELPVKGDGFVRYRPRSPYYWGNPRLVRAIERSSAAVASALPGGAPLYVGDLSAKRGGRIAGHRSHRTGRDADLLWYVTTPSGAPLPSPGFVRVAGDGLAKVDGAPEETFVRLDVERQWRLVRELLTGEDTLVQFLFMSREIEALLIDYARARGEPLELVWQAETVMLQPGDSTPHDDHVHVRLACTPEESVAGCEGGGPYWDWLPQMPSLSSLGLLELERIAQDDPLEIELLPVAGSAGAP